MFLSAETSQELNYPDSKVRAKAQIIEFFLFTRVVWYVL